MSSAIQRLTPLPQAFPALGRAALRALEAQALATLQPQTPSVLMEQAGAAAARLLRALAPDAKRISVLCGPGNNGGDGLVCARHLRQMGLDVRAHRIGGPSRTADHAAALSAAQQAGVEIGPPLTAPTDRSWVVDALLGIGASRAPSGEIAAALAQWQSHPAKRLALDLPTGLDADTGYDHGALRCHHTLTYLAAKPGLFTGAGRDRCGEIWLAKLGTQAPDSGPAQLAGASVLQAWLDLTPRAQQPHLAHKGSQGDVWVWVGAMRGAAHLAAQASLMAGAGRVYLASAPCDGPELASRLEVIACARTGESFPDNATLVLGCGWGAGRHAELATLLARAQRLVLDADGLNACAADPSLQDLLRVRSQRGRATILTPHPLEAARLLETDTPAVQADRLAAAQALASRYGCTVLLKGSGSIVAHPGRTPWIVTTGHGALASAGTGDVLAGWLGGLWAQAPDTCPQQVATLAATWHGLAADAVPLGGGPLPATALLAHMAARHPAPAPGA